MNDSIITVKNMCPTDILQEDHYKCKFILFDEDEEIKVEEVDDLPPRKNPAFEVKNKWGDDMTQFIWDGPEDSDEEI